MNREDSMERREARRRPGLAHVWVAFLSGLLVPGLIAYAVLAVWFPEHYVVVPPQAIGTVVVGALIASIAVYRHKQISLWLAALIGASVVALLAVAPSIWAALLDRGAA